jgi:predicted 3-demethylubiquinone-9 3-methyltransferase (glyoxalase superfamily)
MTDHPIIPCLWFDNQAASAAEFYVATFPRGRVTATSRYPESFDAPGGQPRGSVLTVEFEVAGQRFTALNGGPMLTLNPSISFFVFVDTPAEADRLFAAVADGGKTLMPIDAYPWSERYGWAQDRFGVSWQVIAGRRPPDGAAIVPCLMFSDAVSGRAEEAMRFYAGALPRGEVESVARYEAGEGPEGTVKHGRFRLAGQEMIAMDSHVSHGIAFTEALSLQVMCRDQAEVDHCWAALSDGGREGPCGWLTDRFGVSWQVVPEGIVQWMVSTDVAARDRAFAAMLQMGKLDIAALTAAFEDRSREA